MMSLAGKKIVLGVSGGIAAYKTPDLVRRLRERGADVRVAITEGGKGLYHPTEPASRLGIPGIRQPSRPGGRSRNGPY